jgi:hypothetical protein
VCRLRSYIDIRSLEDNLSVAEKQHEVCKSGLAVGAERSGHSLVQSQGHRAELNIRKDYKSFRSAEMHKEVYVESIKQTEFISTMKLTTSSTGMECSKAPEEG